MASLKVKIVSPDEILFEGEAEYLMAPGAKGMLGLMPMHTPMFAELVAGQIHVQAPTEATFDIAGGIVRIKNDEVLILVNKQAEKSL